jgi:hypothetical protein
MPFILPRPVYTPRSGRPPRSGPVRQDITLINKRLICVFFGEEYSARFCFRRTPKSKMKPISMKIDIRLRSSMAWKS